MAHEHEHVPLSRSGPPETVLPAEDARIRHALSQALATGDDNARRTALDEIVKADPKCLEAWARLAAVARDDVEAYAYARVGYHRGLDTLRGNGWRGSGYVRWRHETNRGFLRSLEALRDAAGRIGEAEEEQRCALFLRQVDPDWPPSDLT